MKDLMARMYFLDLASSDSLEKEKPSIILDLKHFRSSTTDVAIQSSRAIMNTTSFSVSALL